jgi:hypothetical protein
MFTIHMSSLITAIRTVMYVWQRQFSDIPGAQMWPIVDGESVELRGTVQLAMLLPPVAGNGTPQCDDMSTRYLASHTPPLLAQAMTSLPYPKTQQRIIVLWDNII